MSGVALAATLHDPGCADLAATVGAAEDLARLYAGMVIFATEETPGRALGPLVAAGARVTTHPSEYREIGWRRLGAVREAAMLAPAVHLCDFDRLLHWWRCRRDELVATVARIPSCDLLLLGRTERAWATHPAHQLDTEQLANRLVSRLFGAGGGCLLGVARAVAAGGRISGGARAGPRRGDRWRVADVAAPGAGGLSLRAGADGGAGVRDGGSLPG
ncbi:MAG: hypothetical protein U0232_08275 [Thermomicrobiales bacterium]